MSTPSEQHAQKIQDAFSAQAQNFEDPRLNEAFTSGLEGLIAAIAPGGDELCLDVAAGTGHVSRALSPHVRAIVALDAVEEMLVQGVEQARDAGLRNIVFQRGQALELPFPDDTFNLVVTRLSLHHIERPERAVAEMERVCRPGGKIAINDLVRDPEHPSPDEMERLRDPSHLRILTTKEIEEALRKAGAIVVASDVEVRERPLEPWLAQSLTPDEASEQIRERLRQELDGGTETGLRPVQRAGAISFTQHWATVTAKAGARSADAGEDGPGGAQRGKPR